MQEPMFADMSPEELLGWIENAEKALDQKVAAARSDIEDKQQRLAKLLARREGKDAKAKAKVKGKAKANPKAGAKAAPAVADGKPRGRPAKAPKLPEAKSLDVKDEPAVAAEQGRRPVILDSVNRAVITRPAGRAEPR